MFGVFEPVFHLVFEGLMVASIEAPFALLEEPVKVRWFDAVKATQVPLGLVPKVLDAVDVVPRLGEAERVVDPPVMKPAASKAMFIGLRKSGSAAMS